jgi:hypothetical protein
MYTERLRNVHKKGMYVGYVDIANVCDAYIVSQSVFNWYFMADHSTTVLCNWKNCKHKKRFLQLKQQMHTIVIWFTIIFLQPLNSYIFRTLLVHKQGVH